MSLTRDDVVRAAVALLDDVGLEGLTLRRLAADLGVSAPTLYWHVRHKRELLDLMAEAIIVEAGGRSGAPAPGQPWWEWLAEQGRLQWRALVTHRDAALVVAGNRPTDSSLPFVEETIHSLVTAGFAPGDALENLFAVGHYVIGCALEYQAESARQQQGVADVAPPGRLSGWPYLAAAFNQRGGTDPAASFNHGLQLLIDGMRTRLADPLG
ncbi:MAG: TetR/AcrR family transcriptional regulator C-terminal domain-containing protein [Frankiaceae bacterium]